MIVYFLSTLLLSSSTYLFYILLLKKEKNFTFIRFYLIGTLFLSLISPLLSIKIDSGLPTLDVLKEVVQAVNTPIILENSNTQLIKEFTYASFGLFDALLIIYFIVTATFLFRYFRNIKNILLEFNKSERLPNGLRAVYKNDTQALYSFFNILFINRNVLEKEGLHSPKVLHELGHSKQKHSVDILISQLTLCFFWFNPFVWLYKKAICENHEFLADVFVLNKGVKTSDYACTILQSAKHQSHQLFYSGFNFNQTKNRLIMLNKTSTSRTTVITKVVIVAILCLFVFSAGSFTTKDPLVVIIDAGHGGEDPGNMSNNVQEKEINLAIATELKKLSNDNVEIVLLRNDDTYIPLYERVKMLKNDKGTLFLSLHCESSKNSESRGVVAYFSNENKYKDISNTYASILVEAQLSDKNTNGKVKTADFYVLKNNELPAVLLEVGFLSNSQDFERLYSVAGQKEIAQNIFNGLSEIAN